MSENSELLTEFIAYCLLHPDERFWQALRNWSGENFISASRHRCDDCRDTFYWKGKSS